MKALILVGGYGTRLRPLTFSVIKPLVSFIDKPILYHQLEALAKVGVKVVILAVQHEHQQLQAKIPEIEALYNIKIIHSNETEPMGTAGPLKLAEQHLKDGPEDCFFVLNSDVTCEFPLAEMLAAHKQSGMEGTILMTEVKDPSKYGVIVHNEQMVIDRFVEKPTEFVSNKINAGIYILNKSVLNRIELRPTSIEREIFPLIAKDRALGCFCLKEFWMDIGQPKDYLVGQQLFLNYQTKIAPKQESGNQNRIQPYYIHPSAQVHPDAVIGPFVSIGENCKVESGVRIKNSAIFQNTVIKKNSYISESIIGWDSKIDSWCRVTKSVFGSGVELKSELCLNRVMALPYKAVSQEYYAGPKEEDPIILMWWTESTNFLNQLLKQMAASECDSWVQKVKRILIDELNRKVKI